MEVCECGDEYKKTSGDGESIIKTGYCLTCIGIDSSLNLKRDLCVNLKIQKELMEENAMLMKEVYPNGNHVELLGAAKITQYWIDNIEKEEGVIGVFV